MFSLYLLFIHDKDDMKGSESTNSIVDMLKSALVQRQKTTPIATQKQEEDQEDDDNSDTYEEPETQSSQPPPSVPRRAAAPPGSSQSPQHGVPVNRRAVPQIPQIPQMSTMDQSVYEETNTNDESEQVTMPYISSTSVFTLR